MSAKYTFLAWDTPIENAPLKLALLQLANNADDNGFSYYSISKMAIACGMSEKTFQRKIAEMEKMGILEVERRANRPSLYTLVGDEMGVTLCRLQQSEATESLPEATESRLVSDRESPDPVITPETSPESINIKKNHQLVADTWNEILGDTLGRVIKLSDKRKAWINGSVKEFKGTDHDFSNIETWKGLFEYCKQSDFLMGESSNWSMDFDFVINKNNLLKIVEGKYER